MKFKDLKENIVQGQFGSGRSSVEMRIREIAMQLKMEIEQLIEESPKAAEYQEALGPNAIKDAATAVDKLATAVMRVDHPQHFKR